MTHTSRTNESIVEEFGNRTPLELLEATIDDICFDPELRMRAKARCALVLTEKDAACERGMERIKNPCGACGGEGFIMEYDDAPGNLVPSDCGRCKNTGIEPRL